MIINASFSILILSIFTLFLIILLVAKWNWSFREILKFIVTLCVYIGFLTIILFPMPVYPEDAGFSSINFIPLKTIIGYLISAIEDGMIGTAIYQVLGNILLFYILMIVTCWYININTFKKFFIWLIGYAVLTEILQAFVSLILGFLYRSIDIDDIILYCIGGTLSYLTMKVLTKKYRHTNNEEGTT